MTKNCQKETKMKQNCENVEFLGPPHLTNTKK